MNLVKDYMIRDFKILRGDLSPQDATSLLRDISFGVIENAYQQPIWIVTKAEIEIMSTQEKPNLMHDYLYTSITQVREDVEMEAVSKSSLLTTLIQTNVLVTDDSDNIVGILTNAEIQQFLGSGQIHPKGKFIVDILGLAAVGLLAGDFIPMRHYYICRVCRFGNTLCGEQLESITAAPLHSLLCQNTDPNVQPHDLKLN